LLSISLAGQSGPVRMISPTSGPEGTRVTITGQNLQEASAVLFGKVRSDFKIISSDELIVLVPHHTSTSPITVVTPQGRSMSPFPFTVVNDPRIPDEVSYKAGYVNSSGWPSDFHSARLWGIAIADTRVAGHESARVEIAWTQLSCRGDGKEAVLNELLESVAMSGAAARQMGFDYRRSPTMPYSAETTTKRAQATGSFLLISGGKPHSAIWEGHGSSGGAGPAPPGDDLIQFQVFAQNAYVLISSPGDIHDHNIRLLHSRCPLDDLGDGVS
jgi:IPT/TIG domain